MTDDFIPADQEQRDRIATALDETLFVEASAGTGKTRALVTRIANLVSSGKATVDGIAAITFTEAAAAELRDRVRKELEKRAHDSDISQENRDRCLKVVQSLEGASIQTLHSFAGALLRERCLEAGLPPDFEVADEIEADIKFEQRWEQWLDEAMESETVVPHLHAALNLGLRIDSLRTVAKAFHDDYDLLPDSFPPEPEAPRRAVARVIDTSHKIRQLCGLAANGPSDPLASHSWRVGELGDRLARLGVNSDGAQAMLARWGKLSCSKGTQADWDKNPDTGLNGCKELKGLLKELEDERIGEIETARRVALMSLLGSLRHFAVECAEERRRSGKAEFHDLLVWARDLLRDKVEARTCFQQRFSHILIDEFQDTDPIQAEIAFFLSGEPVGDAGSAGGKADWTSVKIVPGKLFVVGDPKQSIYRFRRADIAAVEQVRELMGGSTVALSQNFRSQQTVVEWVNLVFDQWMGTGIPGIQAPYLKLIARWVPPKVEPPLGVHWFGGLTEAGAAQARREEAEEVAAVLRHIKSSSWQVRGSGEDDLRNAEYRDVCILMPTRTTLPPLERALETANIPYRVESQSLVLGTQDVRELLACLRAIDSPADQVALVAAVRSSAFACSDVELLEFVDNGGRFDCTDPGTSEGPVSDALRVLYRYHRERTWTPLDELIERFVRERQMEEICFGRARPRERLRRLRLIVERARAFAQVGGNSLRGFLDWIERQAAENARMVETPVPETDEDAIRIMTIHGAKGLEFPIVVLVGLGGGSNYPSAPVIFDRSNHSTEVSLKADNGPAFATKNYEAVKENGKPADAAEAVRVTYVAATRARDHLIVSLFHTKRSVESRAAAISGFVAENRGCWRELPSLLPAGPVAEVAAGDAKPTGSDTKADRDAWLARRDVVLQTASRPAAVAATTVARIYKEEAERGEVSYRRGRGGANLGRAVHSVLQSVDLATGAGLEEMSKAQAAAEGVAGRWEEVAKLARKGLESPVVKRAVASGRYYREVFVSAPMEEGFVEGFIDLLFEEDDGLVVADYKTDALEGDEALAEKKADYGLQAGVYALAVGQATRRPVSEVVLVFLRSGQEVTITDVDALPVKARERARVLLVGATD